ncbi:MAG TPA: hypothetical protein VFZ61_16225 [Polyangiales bacterium]
MAHKWRFFRAGGVDQVQLSRGADLAHLAELDQKLWVALACPVSGLEIDKRTLELIDTNKDGRVRAPELISAANWATSLLRDPEVLVNGSPALQLDHINSESEEGREVLATAKTLLASAGKPDAKELHISDVGSASEAFGKQAANGDGIVPPESISDAALKAALTDIVAALPTPPVDKGGAKGVNTETLNAFLTDLDAYVGWLDEGKHPTALPLGEATVAAFDALHAVRAKIEDFFSRTRFAAYDLRALEAVNPEQAQLVSAGSHPLSADASELAHFPLARVSQTAGLPLRGPMNPAWSDRIQAFAKSTVEPTLGARDTLTPPDFASIIDKLSGHANWRGKKPTTKAAEIKPERAMELAAPALREQLRALIAADEAEKPKAAALEKVERLVHLHRDLFELANNFVSYRSFYSRRGKAAFQFGQLFLDQREMELVLRVDDAAKHALLGPLSKCYLIYCDAKNSKGEKQAIVAVLSNGDGDNIMAGRNGLFYDRHGMDWDATVTKVVDNPISVRAAFWSPYKKAMRTLEEFVAKRAAAAEAESDAKMGTAVSTAQTAVTEGAPPAGATPPAAPGTPAPPKPPPKLDIGVVAALGVAVGGITAALGALLNSFFGLGVWMPIGVVGLLLAISGPSMAVAWLKLRQRNIGPLLDANGWAVNARAKLNVPLGESMTRVATLPKGAARDFTDPFAEKTRPWGVYVTILLILAIAIAWFFGKFDRYLPNAVQSTHVLGDIAPANHKADDPKPAAAEPKPAPAK